jgi:hypothetical protein
MREDFKISFYVNSHTGKLFRKRNKVSKFVTVGIIIRRNDVRGTTVKENDGDG